MALADDILAPGAGRDVPTPCAGTFRLLYTYTQRDREIEREMYIYIHMYTYARTHCAIPRPVVAPRLRPSIRLFVVAD